MQASTSSYTLSSTPPLESEIWGSSSPSSSPELGSSSRRTLVRRKNGSSNNTPKLSQLNDETKHPLSGPTPPTTHTDILGDVSRPNLKRLTTETERQVAESSYSHSNGNGNGSEFTGSVRGSLDLLRMTPGGEDENREVEVLIHTIKPNESLAGIALLYGIDLATLRKSNKLWSSDPIHIRTHLYVPLESCKWNNAKENLVRGPGEGQVTLLPKKDKGKGREVLGNSESIENGLLGLGLNEKEGIIDLTNSTSITRTNSSTKLPTSSSNLEISNFLPNTNQTYHSEYNSPPTSTEPLESTLSDDTPRILDVVRIPSSQLRFFPKPNKPPDKDSPGTSGRRSIDYFNSKNVPSPKMKYNTISGNSPLQINGLNRNSIDSNDESKERSSIDNTISKANLNIRRDSAQDTGPRIINDLSTLPPSISSKTNSPPKANNTFRSKSTIVKLRPPSAILPNNINTNNTSNQLSDNAIIGGIKDTLKDFFTIPPPPLPGQQSFSTATPGGSLRLKRERITSSPSISNLTRNSLDSFTPKGSRVSSPIGTPVKEEIMELTKTSTRNTSKSKSKNVYPDLGLDLGLGGLGIGFDSKSSLSINGNGKGGIGVLGRKDSLKKGDKQD